MKSAQEKPLVVDADGHIYENVTEIFEYLEPPYAGKRNFLNAQLFWPMLDGWNRAALSAQYGLETPMITTPKGYSEMLDVVGIDRSILFPTKGLAHGLIRDTRWSVALARAYNSWIADRYCRSDERLHFVALLPMQDPDAAAAELRRAVTELGAVGGMLPGAGLRLPLGAREFAPVYAEADRLSTALVVHAAPATSLPDMFSDFMEVQPLTHSVAQMTQMCSMFQSGVIDKYPNLRVAFFEAGMSWVPHVLGRLERTSRVVGKYSEPVYAVPQRKPPVEHLRDGRIFFGLEGEEPMIGATQEYLGADCLCFATDFPHENYSAQKVAHELQEIRELDDVSPATRAGMIGENAARLYRLNVPVRETRATAPA